MTERLTEPLIWGELDVATGVYFCPNCGVGITTDLWEEMRHELRHWNSEEEVEVLMRDYGPEPSETT